jgi:nucleotide-binding universal stress UspA family protein
MSEVMMIKDILVRLERDPGREIINEFAVSLAELFDAHLTGVSFTDKRVLEVSFSELPSDVVRTIVTEAESAAQAAIDRFARISEHRLSSVAHRLIDERGLSPQRAFAQMARCFDLSVIMQPDPDTYADDAQTIEAALFESGRPVIAVPYIQRQGVVLDQVVCCWDGGRAAARAIGDALPLLKIAKNVRVLTIANNDSSALNEVRELEIGAHLARHGIKIDVEVSSAPDVDVADTILNWVADQSASMVVMGGYGHSRLREFVLGGVTRTMLSSMTVPVFLSH